MFADDDRAAMLLDASVAASPSCIAGGTPPLKMRIARLFFQALGLFFTANLVAAALYVSWLLPPLPPTLDRAACLLFALEAVMYAIALALACSPLMQGWITFGHPARIIGAANSAGPFDRGARVVGVRDYLSPAQCGLPHARLVRIPTADGAAELGAWHVLPAGSSLRVAERVAAAGEAQTDAIFDDELRSAPRAPTSFLEEGPLAALYLHGNFESRAKWVSTRHAELLANHLGLVCAGQIAPDCF